METYLDQIEREDLAAAGLERDVNVPGPTSETISEYEDQISPGQADSTWRFRESMSIDTNLQPPQERDNNIWGLGEPTSIRTSSQFPWERNNDIWGLEEPVSVGPTSQPEVQTTSLGSLAEESSRDLGDSSFPINESSSNPQELPIQTNPLLISNVGSSSLEPLAESSLALTPRPRHPTVEDSGHDNLPERHQDRDYPRYVSTAYGFRRLGLHQEEKNQGGETTYDEENLADDMVDEGEIDQENDHMIDGCYYGQELDFGLDEDEKEHDYPD